MDSIDKNQDNTPKKEVIAQNAEVEQQNDGPPEPAPEESSGEMKQLLAQNKLAVDEKRC